MRGAKKQGFLYRFLLRWVICSLGLWIAAGLLRNSINYGDHVGAIIISGLVLALINTVIKPILVVATVPAILLTLGLFMVVINGATVWLASKFYSGLAIHGFGTAILAGIIIGLVNYLVTAILEER